MDPEALALWEAVKAGKITDPERIKAIRLEAVRQVIATHERDIAEIEYNVDRALEVLKALRVYRQDALTALSLLENDEI